MLNLVQQTFILFDPGVDTPGGFGLHTYVAFACVTVFAAVAARESHPGGPPGNPTPSADPDDPDNPRWWWWLKVVAATVVVAGVVWWVVHNSQLTIGETSPTPPTPPVHLVHPPGRWSTPADTTRVIQTGWLAYVGGQPGGLPPKALWGAYNLTEMKPIYHLQLVRELGFGYHNTPADKVHEVLFPLFDRQVSRGGTPFGVIRADPAGFYLTSSGRINTSGLARLATQWINSPAGVAELDSAGLKTLNHLSQSPRFLLEVWIRGANRKLTHPGEAHPFATTVDEMMKAAAAAK